MNLLQNKTVLKLTKEKLIQDYVFDKEFAKCMLSYSDDKDSQSLQDFLRDYVMNEFFEDSLSLYQEKSINGAGDDGTLWDKLYVDESLQTYTRRAEISKRPNVSYDLTGFEKIDGVLYYITGENSVYTH